MAKGRFPSFPAFWYDPTTGEGKVFEHANDIPKGWIDNPHTARELAAKGPPEADLDGDGYATVAEIKAALEAGKVTVDQVEAAENAREKPRTTVIALIEKHRAEAAEQDALLTREEAIAELREAGVEIDDTATDEEIEAALAGLEG